MGPVPRLGTVPALRNFEGVKGYVPRATPIEHFSRLSGRRRGRHFNESQSINRLDRYEGSPGSQR